MVVVGIGGAYLGARAALEMLLPYFPPGARATGAYPEVIFAGHHLSGTYLQELLHYLEDKEFCLNVISKSGTTTETAVAFRFLRKLAEEKYGKEGAAARIYATTDRQKGALRRLAQEAGYQTFTIPADVGGRYSVLTPVGLFPLAVAGLDLEQIRPEQARLMRSVRFRNRPKIALISMPFSVTFSIKRKAGRVDGDFMNQPCIISRNGGNNSWGE